MKTAKEWFEENLNEEQYQRAMVLIEYQGKLDRLNDEHASFEEALNESFCWGDIPINDSNWDEEVYWSGIHSGKTPGVMPWKKEEQAELEIAKKLLEDNGYLVKKKRTLTLAEIAEKFGLKEEEIEIEK